MTPDKLRLILPLAEAAADTFAPHLEAAAAEFQIQPGKEFAMWIAQLGYECQQFRRLEEDLNYKTPQRLLQVYGTRFGSIDQATAYVGQPQRIANRAYAGRYGNGPEASGDGWRYRGRGPTMLTFADNYAAGSRALFGDPQVLLQNPDRALLPEVGCRLAGWFWAEHKCAGPARAGDVRAVTRLINGPKCEGLDGRAELFARACRVLGV